MKVDVIKKPKNGAIVIFIDSVDFGTFECGFADDSSYSFFPKRQEQLTGDHYIAIGEALNALNKESATN